LEKQYDIRYGRQRDTWHFEPAVKMMMTDGEHVSLTDIKLDKNVFVMFSVIDSESKRKEYECGYFAYGELSKVIEALPNAEDIVWDNAVNDLKIMTTNLRIDYLLADAPFKYEVGSKHCVVDDVKCVNGTLSLVQALGNDTPVSDLPLETLVALRDHININVLHKYNEYNKLVKFLSEQPNLCFEPHNFGDVEFTIHGTDVKVDVLSASLDSNDKLKLCVDDDNKEAIYLEEKDIRPEYLVDLVGYIEDHCRCDIMDTYNAHNPELVRKINDAWKKEGYHKLFGTILLALLYRDNMEYEQKFGEILDYSEEYAMEHAHEIMEGVCDDLDLETILSFIRYKED
jgi:hypothetical protein